MSGKHEIITAQQLKLVEFEIFSVNVIEKLVGYSKFSEKGNYTWRGPCVFYGLFEWKKSAGHVNVLCKTVSHRTVEPPLFPAALTFNFISKDVVMVKSQIRYFTSLTGVLTGRKTNDAFFTQLEPVL